MQGKTGSKEKKLKKVPWLNGGKYSIARHPEGGEKKGMEKKEKVPHKVVPTSIEESIRKEGRDTMERLGLRRKKRKTGSIGHHQIKKQESTDPSGRREIVIIHTPGRGEGLLQTNVETKA